MHDHHDLLSLRTAAIVIAGRDASVAWASPAVRDLLLYEPEDLVGRPIEVLVPKEYTTRHRAGWTRAWRRNHMPQPTTPVMIPVVCGDDEIRKFASHLLPLYAPHGELLAVAAVWVSPSEADATVRDLA